MKRLKIIYIGTSISAIKVFKSNSDFHLLKIICEKKRITHEIERFVNQYFIEIVPFTNKNEFDNIIEENLDLVDFLFIYQFDYIINSKYTSTNKFFNFHSGSLKLNRGAHPIIRSILNGDIETEFSLHMIDSKIDLGFLIGTYPVKITKEDNTITLKEKLELGFIPLLSLFFLFINNNLIKERLFGGVYYPPIKVDDYTIDINSDSLELICRKINSQKQYKGAILVYENVKYFITNFEIKNNKKLESKPYRNGSSIYLFFNDLELVLFVNTNI